MDCNRIFNLCCKSIYDAPQQQRLQSEGFDSDLALDDAIKKLDYDLKRTRKKEADGDDLLVKDFLVS